MPVTIRLSPDDKIDIPEKNTFDEATWDVDKWREQHPVDYINAVKVLNCFPEESRLNAFREIFKVTRLYLPEILYKYYSFTDDQDLNKLKLNTLADKKIFLSELNKFNDPFDGRAMFYSTSDLNQFDTLKKHNGRLVDDFASFHIGASLSASNYTNMPMWAHYANNHKGYCVSYKTAENFMISSFAFPIQYLDARVDITDYLVRFVDYMMREKNKNIVSGEKVILIDDLTLVLVFQLLDNIKGTDWSYEKEFRISLPKTHPERYIELKPYQIYIGKNCDYNCENALVNIAKQQNITAYKIIQGDATEGFAMKTDLKFAP